MKKILLLTLAALGLLVLPQAGAWAYSDGDALLIFRDGSHDVEFDLGNVSQFTGKTNGYTVAVTNWSFTLVTNTFGPDLTVATGDGVTAVLVATTSSTDPNPITWLSGSEPNTTAYNPSASGWGNIYSTINSVGISPKVYNVPSNSVPQSYVIGTTGSGNAGKYKYASYDYIVSGGTYNGISKLGNNTPFIVEQTIPGSFDFWKTKATANPVLPPDNLVGTFSITANGLLTFVAGPRQSNITAVTRSGNVSTVQFTTTIGNTYAVAYTNFLGGAAATWPVDATTLVGDGNINTLNHTNPSGAEFYRISTQ
jgi:hypothetical protein